jgi:hypothetical protein
MRQLAPPDRFTLNHHGMLARLVRYDHKTSAIVCKRLGW